MVITVDKEEIVKNLNFLIKVSEFIQSSLNKIKSGEREIYVDVEVRVTNVFKGNPLKKLDENHTQINNYCINIIKIAKIELEIFNTTLDITINDENKNNLKQIYQLWSELGKLLGNDLNVLSKEISAENELILSIEKYEKLIETLKKGNIVLVRKLNDYITEKSKGNLEIEDRYIYFSYLIIKYFVDNKNNIRKGMKEQEKLKIAINCFDYLVSNQIKKDDAESKVKFLMISYKLINIKYNDEENIKFLVKNGFNGKIIVSTLTGEKIDITKSIQYQYIKNGINIAISQGGLTLPKREIKKDKINSIIEPYNDNTYFIDLIKVLNNNSSKTSN